MQTVLHLLPADHRIDALRSDMQVSVSSGGVVYLHSDDATDWRRLARLCSEAAERLSPTEVFDEASRIIAASPDAVVTADGGPIEEASRGE